MSEFFLGQVMMTGFGFAPKQFAACNGQLMPVNQNQSLFSLLGVQFGGDGRTTFGLPDLRGRTPLGAGPSMDVSWRPVPYAAGHAGGLEAVTLEVAQVPAHQHMVMATTAEGGSRTPAGNLIAASTASLYGPAAAGRVGLSAQTVGQGAAARPHENRQPYTTINFCIALGGIFPSRD